MKITPKFTFVSGSFDTDEVKMLCLPSDNHGKVDLCIKEKDCAWNIPIGGVKLHDRDLYVDFKATLEDATNLGNEIARRWNEFKELEANQSQWISVNDAIPKDNAEGICKVKFVDDSIDEMTMRKVSKWVFPYTKGKYVTHWKPIAKPKEVKE